MKQELIEQEYFNILSDFYKDSDKRLCLVDGETGFFKTFLIDESMKEYGVNSSYLVFKIRCFESTTLDDIFLYLLENLKVFSQQKKVSFSKIEMNSISQRINFYLNNINSPMIIVFDSLQNVFNKSNNKDKEEIIDFIKHLINTKKIKIILVSSMFPNDITESFLQDNSHINIVKMKSLSQNQSKIFLQTKKVCYTDEEFAFVYRLSKGNPYILNLIAIITTTLKTNILNLLNEFKQKKVSFEKYLYNKLFTFVPNSSLNSLKIISFCCTGLPMSYLVKENFFTKEQILYMLDKNILAQEQDLIFVRPDVRCFLHKTITNFEKNRIHNYWKNFYVSQLPLKPNERNVLISRNTMRAQIEYHSQFVQNVSQNTKSNNNLSLMSYIKSHVTNWNELISQDDNGEEDTPITKKTKVKSKEDDLQKYELTKDEVRLLELSVDLGQDVASKFVNLNRTQEQKAEEVSSSRQKQSLSHLFELANTYQNKHNFEEASALYLEILNNEECVGENEFYSTVLENLALCCEEMNKTVDAIGLYNKLSELYSSGKLQNIEKLNLTKLKIARVYRKTYKINQAILICQNFINKKDEVSNNIKILSYIELASIEEDLSNLGSAMEFYNQAFDLIKDNDELEMIKNDLAIAYFKYALIMDDFNKTDKAIEYYKKCIRNANRTNHYMSSALTNLAEIYLDKKNKGLAFDYYEKALDIDIEQNNYDGIYYISVKMALSNPINSPARLDWLLKALSAAKKNNEHSYIINVYEELGKYYKANNDTEKANNAFAKAENMKEKANKI